MCVVYLSQLDDCIWNLLIKFAGGTDAFTFVCMRDTELKRKKADALYSVYKKGLQEGRFSSLYDAGRSISRSPAPCYFISAKRASLLIGRISARISLIGLNDSQRRMAWQLWHKYQEYLAAHPDNTLSRERILEMLVDEPAPEFYISTDGARRLLCEQIRKTRKKMGW